MVVLVRATFFIALLAAAFGAASAQERTGTRDAEVAPPAQAVSVEPAARDEEIAQRILKILEATGWYDGLRVAVNDGVVFLDGTSGTADHKTWARDLASKTQDVVAVVNRIAVVKRIDWTFRPALEEVSTIIGSAVAAIPLLVLSIIILPLAWLAAKFVASLSRNFLAGRIRSNHLRNVVARFIAVPVFLLGLYVVLQVAGLTQLAISVVGGASLIGIVLGLAFRDIAENFLASLLLSIRHPFRAGDLIDVSGLMGTVQSMNTRCTVLLSQDGNHILIPNATVYKNTIVNYSAAPARREWIGVGIGYDDPVGTAQDLIRRVLQDHPAVIDDPEPIVLVDSLGSATVNLRAYYWFDGEVYSPIKLKSSLLRLTKKALLEGGISMPDEAREIIFPQGVPVVGGGDRREGRATAAGGDGKSRAPAAAALPQEPDASAIAAEGNLGNEQEAIEEQAASADIPEDRTDLLAERR